MSALPNPTSPTFDVVPPGEIDAIWPLIAGGVERALASADGEATVEDTRAGLLAGRTQLAIIVSKRSLLGIVFMFLNFPRYKIARILLAFGHDMEGAREAMDCGERWAKEQGCRYCEAWVSTAARERMFGRYGYKPAYRILRKAL